MLCCLTAAQCCYLRYTGISNLCVRHVQKQDDFEAGAGFDEGQMRDETTPENLRVMEAMLQHVDEHYDGIMGYLRHIGLNDDEASRVYHLG